MGADAKEQAKILAKSVITSNLTKAAITDMMPTGDESCVHWDIPGLSLIRKRWICILKAQQEN